MGSINLPWLIQSSCTYADSHHIHMPPASLSNNYPPSSCQFVVRHLLFMQCVPYQSSYPYSAHHSLLYIYMTPNFRSIRHFSSCLYAAEHQVYMLSVIMVICYPWFLYAALSSGQYDVRHQVYVPPVFMSVCCASSFQYDSCHYGYKWPLISSICHP